MSDSPRKLILALVAVLVLAAGGITIYLVASDDSSPAPAPVAGEQVRIEIRALPQMSITMDGKKVGKTPLSLRLPRSDKPITFEATYTAQLVSRQGEKLEERVQKRVAIPDRDLVIDFHRGGEAVGSGSAE